MSVTQWLAFAQQCVNYGYGLAGLVWAGIAVHATCQWIKRRRQVRK